jgi:hypothetical protein
MAVSLLGSYGLWHAARLISAYGLISHRESHGRTAALVIRLAALAELREFQPRDHQAPDGQRAARHLHSIRTQ